jgi:hypothetical protein
MHWRLHRSYVARDANQALLFETSRQDSNLRMAESKSDHFLFLQ